MKIKLTLVLLIILQVLIGQYYQTNQYLLEKDFNDSDNFLKPRQLLLKESFDQDLLWLEDDSLSNVFINPAILKLQKNKKVIVSYNDMLKNENLYYRYPIYWDYYSSCIAPSVYMKDESSYTRPLINVFAIKPLISIPITLGFAYSYNWYEDNKKSFNYINYFYYPLMNDGMISNFPYLNDGKFDMSNKQHNVDLLTSYQLSERIALGLKLSVMLGNTSKNFDYDYKNPDDFNSNFQELGIEEVGKTHQYEISSSAFYNDKKKKFGINGGWIFGEQKQDYAYLDTVQNYNQNLETSSLYMDTRKSANDKNWNHKGNSFYFNAIGSIKHKNLMFLCRLDFIKSIEDIVNNANSYENLFYLSENNNYYTKRTNIIDYEIKGDGEEEFSKRSAATAIRLYQQKNYLSIGVVYLYDNCENTVVELGNRYYANEFFNEPESLDDFQYETKKVNTKINNIVKNELFKIPVTLMLSNTSDLRFKATVMKIFGTNQIKDHIHADYKNYYRHTRHATYDSAADEEYKNKDKKKINTTNYNLYIEYDFYENIQLFLSVYAYKIDDQMKTIRYYFPDDDKEYQVNDWKFGIIYNFK